MYNHNFTYSPIKEKLSNDKAKVCAHTCNFSRHADMKTPHAYAHNTHTETRTHKSSQAQLRTLTEHAHTHTHACTHSRAHIQAKTNARTHIHANKRRYNNHTYIHANTHIRTYSLIKPKGKLSNCHRPGASSYVPTLPITPIKWLGWDKQVSDI